MRIQAIDQDNNLFSVEDIVPASLAQALDQHDWSGLAGNPSLPQPGWQRSNIDASSHALLRELDAALIWSRYQIQQQLGLQFSYCYTDFWLDRGGFSVPVHTDSVIASSLQLYWHGPAGTGTTFLNSKNPNDVRYQMQFRPNSGYLMLNMSVDGVQPLQWHGMFQDIDRDSIRLTSYTRLGPYWR